LADRETAVFRKKKEVTLLLDYYSPGRDSPLSMHSNRTQEKKRERE
jgi:hypothetical protein